MALLPLFLRGPAERPPRIGNRQGNGEGRERALDGGPRIPQVGVFRPAVGRGHLIAYGELRSPACPPRISIGVPSFPRIMSPVNECCPFGDL